MVYNYIQLTKKIRELRRNYKFLTIDEKLDLLQLELKVEGKKIVCSDAINRNEKRKEKDEIALRRNQKADKAKRQRSLKTHKQTV
jgi:hypothetical protein